MTDTESPDWNEIVKRHGKRVFRVSLRILGSVHDAEDVAQDVFSEAYRLHRQGPVQSWTGLLVRLATLRSIDRLRRTRQSVALRDEDRLTTVEPIEEAVATELAHWLRQAVVQLPDQQATVFVMYHFEHLSHEEIAMNLGISREAVGTALYKARQQLLEQLAVFNRGDLK